MSRKRYTPEQIISMLREAEVALAQGQSVGQACRTLGVSEQSYYRWRKEYGGLRTDQAKRLAPTGHRGLTPQDTRHRNGLYRPGRPRRCQQSRAALCGLPTSAQPEAHAVLGRVVVGALAAPAGSAHHPAGEDLAVARLHPLDPRHPAAHPGPERALRVPHRGDLLFALEPDRDPPLRPAIPQAAEGNQKLVILFPRAATRTSAIRRDRRCARDRGSSDARGGRPRAVPAVMLRPRGR